MAITNIIFLVLGCLWLVFTLVVYIFNPWGWEFARRPKPVRREMTRPVLPSKNYFSGDDPTFPELGEDLEARPGIHVLDALGVSLASLPERYGDVLRKRVREDTFRLAGVIPHPAFIESVAKEEIKEYWQIEKDALLDKINGTIEFFEELSILAQQNGKPDGVKLWGMNTLPHLGIIAINPGNPDAVIRASPYSTHKCGVKHPVIIARRDGTESVFQQYYDTYERLKSSNLTVRII